MRKYILAVIALAASAIGMNAEDMKTVFSLFVNTASGDKIEYAFDNKPVATFEAEDLVITVAGKESVKYPIADVVNITFASTEVSGVENVVSSSDLTIKITSTSLSVNGLDANTEVKIYSTTGALVAASVADAFGNCEISVESLANGIYVVAIPGHSFKFVK